MYLHVGKNKNIRTDTIIGIFDMDHATLSRVTKRFLHKAQETGCVALVAEDVPRSFLLTAERPVWKKQRKREKQTDAAVLKQHVYLSQLSAQTLAKRCEHFLS